MNPIEPWIDAEAVRRLAQQLATPPSPAEEARPVDPGFGPRFEGFIEASSPPAEPERPVPSPIKPEPRPFKSPAVESPLQPETKPVALGNPPAQEESVTSPVPVPDPPAVEANQASPPPDPRPAFERNPPPKLPEERKTTEGRGPLVARMEGFRDWLERALGAHGVFILDRDGEPVIDAPAYSKLHFLARSLAQASRPVKGEAGNVHVKVGSDAYLAVVPVNTAFGRLVLAAVLAEPLDAESVGVVSEALVRAVRPETR